MNPAAPITPKEFADAVFGGRRSARWVRRQCAQFVTTKGRAGIAVISPARPYLIPAVECDRWRAPIVFSRACKVA